jgi:hypothetical protein
MKKYLLIIVALAACSHRTPIGADDKNMYLEECKIGNILFCEMITVPTQGRATTTAINNTNVTTFSK